MEELKLILLCGNRMALPVMRDLVFAGQLAAVVIPVHCDAFISEVQLLLMDRAIPVILVSKADYVVRLQETIVASKASLGLIVTFSFRLPPEVYQLPTHGFFNLHPGPLPAYRGPDPIFWQIRNREPFASVTLHRVEAEYDAGGVVLAEKIRIAPDDTYGILTARLSELSARLAGTLVRMMILDIAIPTRAQDPEKAKYYPRQGAGEVSIDWTTMDADQVIALVHACNPWNKGAVTRLEGRIVRILEAVKISGAIPAAVPAVPGMILRIGEEGMFVSTISDSLLIPYVYLDEGFLPASRLEALGFRSGQRFE